MAIKTTLRQFLGFKVAPLAISTLLIYIYAMTGAYFYILAETTIFLMKLYTIDYVGKESYSGSSFINAL